VSEQNEKAVPNCSSEQPEGIVITDKGCIALLEFEIKRLKLIVIILGLLTGFSMATIIFLALH